MTVHYAYELTPVRSLIAVDNGASRDGQIDGGVTDFCGGDREDIVTKHGDVGLTPDLEDAEDVLVTVHVGDTLGEGVDRVLH